MFTRGYHYGKHFLSELFNLDGAGSRWVEAWAGQTVCSAAIHAQRLAIAPAAIG